MRPNALLDDEAYVEADAQDAGGVLGTRGRARRGRCGAVSWPPSGCCAGGLGRGRTEVRLCGFALPFPFAVLLLDAVLSPRLALANALSTAAWMRSDESRMDSLSRSSRVKASEGDMSSIAASTPSELMLRQREGRSVCDMGKQEGHRIGILGQHWPASSVYISTSPCPPKHLPNRSQTVTPSRP